MDRTRAAVPVSTAGIPVLQEGEVWVAMPYKPAFPGIIPDNETPPGIIEDQTRFPVLHNPHDDVEVGLRCRPAVARWIGIHLESFYGPAQYRSTWRGDTLEINDDPCGESDEPRPRVIRPGDDGRYKIRDLWYPLPQRRSAGCINATPTHWSRWQETARLDLTRTCWPT